ncbi:MAG: PAS domain S-box protein [Magnetococcales bacterium]|nr:PAS domain S-box protein [Magnetococcales bacterium]
MSTDLMARVERLRREKDVQKVLIACHEMAMKARSPESLLEGTLELLPQVAFLGVRDKGVAFRVDRHTEEMVRVAQRNMKEVIPERCPRLDDGRGNVPIYLDGQLAGMLVLFLKNDAHQDPECRHFLESTAGILAEALKRFAEEDSVLQGAELARLIIETAPCGVVVADTKGLIGMFNKEAEALFGYQGAEIIGRNVQDLVPPPWKQLHSEAFQRLQKTGESQIPGMPPFEIEALRKDGSLLPVRLVVNRMVIRGQSFFVAMIADISREKSLRNELLQVERIIIESAPFGIVVTDENDTIQIFNSAAEALFSYRREEVVGHKVRKLIPIGLKAAQSGDGNHASESGDALASGGTAYEAQANRKDGSVFPIRLAVNPLMMEGRPSFVGMVVDMTEEKRLYSELVQSEKMAGLGNMVAGVAHEINTPVGIGVTAASELEESNLAFSTLVENEGISEEELYNHIDKVRRLSKLIRRNLERAAELVHSFKSVAVDQSSEKLRAFKVREYVESAVLTLHHELRNTRLGIMVICSNDLEIRSHPGALSQIVINLINNSRIHAFEPGEEGGIIMEFKAERERLRFSYCDDGRGMEEETRRRIFEPFYTTRRDLGGSGLGMHIVYNLVTQTLGGTITCQSAPGCGMCVEIEIPLQR